jgi:hypothetical protein
MTAIQQDEIGSGLVVHLDTDRLRALGGSRTNAQATAEEDRAVTGGHEFVVAMIDRTAREVLALPLFPRSAPGSAPLVDALRVGGTEWLSQPRFYSQWQHWRIPFDALIEASGEEPTVAGSRRGYGTGKADVLQALANWATRNRCAFRPA